MIKTYTPTTPPDGRIVVVNKDKEINYQRDYFYCPNQNAIKEPGANLSEPIGHKDYAIIFTINFNLPGVNELQVVEEAENIYNEKQVLSLLDKLAYDIILKKTIGEFPVGGMSVFYTYVNQWLKSIPYKAATGQKYSLEDLRKAFEYFQYKPFPHNTGYLTFEQFIQSLTPSIAEVRVEWEENKIKSVSGKDQHGNEIIVRLKL